jgi:two-component system, LytTR family, sensor kinase
MTNKQRIIFHICFWLFFFFSSDVLNLIGNRNYTFSLADMLQPLTISSTIFRLLITYGILYILNLYLPQRQYIKLFSGFLAVCAIYVSIRYLVEEVLFLRWFGIHNYYPESLYASFYIIDNIKNVIFFSFGAFFLKMIEDFFRNEKEKNALITEKLSAEQAFLKNQLNPHFLFNTLNNIYSLTLTQNPKAPEAVLKLSELMRYMLYESNEEKVSLQTEVKYLHNYIELQKIRYSGDSLVDFQAIGDFHSQKIAPLLLIAFVENAFKHGEINKRDSPLKISLLLNQNNLNFVIENYKKEQNKDSTGGIGLENVNRRLNLIYPNQHSLTIEENDKTYTCELNLIL